jgi:hypothetical protein
MRFQPLEPFEKQLDKQQIWNTTLIVVGVLLWLVNNYIPMDYKIKQILNVVVVIAVILWVLNVFGVLSSLRGIQVGK